MQRVRLPHSRSCFVCGLENKHGLQLDFETDGETVIAHYTPRPEDAGFKSVTHGGIIATLLDEIMVWAIGTRTRRFAYCAELSVRFLKPAHPGTPLLATGRLQRNLKFRLFEAEGTLTTLDGTLLATATGKYLPIRTHELQEMLADFAEPFPKGLEPTG